MQTPSTTLYVRESRLTVFETAMVRDRLPDEPEVAPFRPNTEAAPALCTGNWPFGFAISWHPRVGTPQARAGGFTNRRPYVADTEVWVSPVAPAFTRELLGA